MQDMNKGVKMSKLIAGVFVGATLAFFSHAALVPARDVNTLIRGSDLIIVGSLVAQEAPHDSDDGMVVIDSLIVNGVADGPRVGDKIKVHWEVSRTHVHQNVHGLWFLRKIGDVGYIAFDKTPLPYIPVADSTSLPSSASREASVAAALARNISSNAVELSNSAGLNDVNVEYADFIRIQSMREIARLPKEIAYEQFRILSLGEGSQRILAAAGYVYLGDLSILPSVSAELLDPKPSQRASVRALSDAVLEARRDPGLLPFVRKYSNSSDLYVREQSLNAFRGLATLADVPALVGYLKAGHSSASYFAADALARLKGDSRMSMETYFAQEEDINRRLTVWGDTFRK